MKHHHLISFLRALPAAVITMALCSCAGFVPYKPGIVKTATVRLPTVAQQMTFETRGSRWMNAFGVVGSAISVGMALSPEEQLRQHYAAELRKAVVEEISARGQFRLVPEGQGKGSIEIDSPGWGFVLKGMGGPFSGQTMASGLVWVTMKDQSGRIIWKEAAPKTQADLNDSTAYPASELKANPALMRKELSDLARRRARQIAATLPQGTSARTP